MVILVDTSVLLAGVFAKDANHVRADNLLRSLRGQVQIVPAPVLSELFHMTRIRMNYARAITVFTSARAVFQIESLSEIDMLRMEQIMIQYANAEFDYTDTAIMAVAERLKITRVATFDHRDFSIYRPTHCAYLELLP